MVEQKLHDLFLASQDRMVDGSQAEAVLCAGQLRIAFHQRLDLCEIAASRGVVNLAADGGTAPNRSGQDQQRSAAWDRK
jgi:hypothetical protein